MGLQGLVHAAKIPGFLSNCQRIYTDAPLCAGYALQAITIHKRMGDRISGQQRRGPFYATLFVWQPGKRKSMQVEKKEADASCATASRVFPCLSITQS
ncbi:MAG: hypothetical protein EOM90_14015 [Alphaproteobacteria bacterium]|nr:hypothetical protein [Alphaproteobacteria bacterium]